MPPPASSCSTRWTSRCAAEEAEGRVTKYEYWEWLGTVKDGEGRCIGSVAMDLRTNEIRTFPAEAVCLATGGPGIVFGRSTNSIINTGTAAGRAFMEGAVYANGEFIQVHPTAIPGRGQAAPDERVGAGEGGRVLGAQEEGRHARPQVHPRRPIASTSSRRSTPKYKNLVPRDVATREIFTICREMGPGPGWPATPCTWTSRTSPRTSRTCSTRSWVA